MKTIRINGIEQDIPAGALVFEDFINNLNNQLGEKREVISSIRLDGKEISEEQEAALLTTPLDKLGELEVQTANPADLAYDTLNTLEVYIDRMVTTIERASTYYKEKNLVSGDAYFAKAIDGLDLFVQTIGGVKLALRVGLNPKVAIAEATMVSIMNDLLEAKRQNNYVYMAELLEKELIENLCEWKDQIFPLFRSWKTA